MEGLGSFLLFAVLFYVMMRYGCGAHMIHGHHSGHSGHNAGGGKFIDPVCGKEVNPEQGYGVMHKGDLFRFCSRQCLDQFDEQPSLFIKKQKEGHHE
jgi:YHS domain-containing protein